MTGEGGIVRKDVKDYGKNCAVPWGEFTAGNVVLMELEKMVKVRVGDAFLFRGKWIAHTREAVQGVRGLVISIPTRICRPGMTRQRDGRGGTKENSSERTSKKK
jgi:hypothetical protein